MIFLFVGVVAVLLGAVLIIFRKAAASHAEWQISKVIRAENRPTYAPWFIVIIGVGMVLIGGYFIVTTLVRLSGQ